MSCLCGETKTKEENLINKVGNPYIKQSCAGCGKYIKFLEQENTDPCDFRMPFGKHKGKELSEIFLLDRAYLEWIAANFNKNNIKEKVKYVLNKMSD